MRKFLSWFTALGLLVVLALGVAAPADAAKYFWLGVVDELGQVVSSGVTCRVLTTNEVGTNATVYTTSSLGTAASNPITANAQGVCGWWGGDATTSYDVIVYHQRGIARLEAVTEADHRVVINRMHPYKQVVFAFSGASAGTEVDTAIDLPEGAMVVDIVVETITGAPTASIAYLNVGLRAIEGGDPSGFCQGCLATPQGTSSASPGFFRASGSRYGSAGNWYIGSFTRGSYLVTASTGYSSGSAHIPSFMVDNFYVVPRGGPKSITYTVGTLAGVTTLAGYVHLFFIEVGNR
jgi:hypothetical protein